MKISGRQLLANDESVIWAALADPYALSQIIPGCESVEPAGADDYRVTINLRVGTITDRFSGLLKLNPHSGSSTLDFYADGESTNGLVFCRGQLTLDTANAVDTAVCYEAEIDVGGRIASMPPRLLETTARSFARRCLEGLDQQMTRSTRIYTTSLQPVEPAPNTSGSHHRDINLYRLLTFVLFPIGVFLLLRNMNGKQAREIARQVAQEVDFSSRSEL